MLTPESIDKLKGAVQQRVIEDKGVLDALREEIRPLRSMVRRIHPRNTTSISIVATDGGDNRLELDPYLIHLVRVVDSSNNEYCLEVLSPGTDIREVAAYQFSDSGMARTALGEMMSHLGVETLPELSHMIRTSEEGRARSPSWIGVYRELVEWATLFSLIRNKDFGTDTLIIRDGLLRSKVFARDLFSRYKEALNEAIEAQRQKNNRRIYVAGVAKRSKVLARYRLAMDLEGVLRTNYPSYVEVPRDIEQKAYVWMEYALGDDTAFENITEINRFVAGKMFLVKFGNSTADPIWPVDILTSQVSQSQTILGSMLADALNGFPVPFYPLCLQRAHEIAALIDFDWAILQDMLFDGIRRTLGSDAPRLDVIRLRDIDPARARY